MNAVRVLTKGFNILVARWGCRDFLYRQHPKQIGNYLFDAVVATQIIDILVVQLQLVIHEENAHTLVECVGLLFELKRKLVE